MSMLVRSEVRASMRAFITASEEMRSLENAMRVLYKKGRKPSVTTMAETILFSVLHTHENGTRGTVTNLNNAMARVLDDLEALRLGKSIEGRTAGLHAADLAIIAKALDDIDVLQARIKFMLETDPTGNLVNQLKVDFGVLLKGGGKRPPGGIPRPAEASGLLPHTFDSRAADLGEAIAKAAPTPQGIWNKGRLPKRVRDAAHNLVVAAGGDIAAAVKKILAKAGPEADAMVIAVLWAEKKIAPGTPLSQTVEHAQHQTAVTGLAHEWTGAPSKQSMGQSIGLDGIAGGKVVDAKHSNVPAETLSHLADDLVPPKNETPFWARDTEQTVDQQLAQINKPRSRPNEERALWEAQHDYLDQMRRQLDWAREHGLKGISWVFNDPAHAEAFRKLAEKLPSDYKSMELEFVVGGLK